MEKKTNDFNISVSLPKNELSELESKTKVRDIVHSSRHLYAGKKEEVEAELFRLFSETPKEVEQNPIPAPQIVPRHDTSEALIFQEKPLHERAAEFVQNEEEKTEIREHRYLQELSKRTGESFGFRSTTEEPTSDGGRVDVSLTKDDLRIAIEISVTTSPEHELANIRKCIRSEYTHVVATSKNPKQLSGIKSVASSDLTSNELALVSFLSPEQIGEFLEKFASLQDSTVQTVKGYRVKL